MANFFDDLRAFIERQGFSPVFSEHLPADPDEVIAFFVYGNLPKSDGSISRMVQVQVRHHNPSEAYRIATELSHILDSGSEEKIIHLTPDRWCHCAPTKRPKSFGQDAQKRTTYYFEVTLFGPDGI